MLELQFFTSDVARPHAYSLDYLLYADVASGGGVARVEPGQLIRPGLNYFNGSYEIYHGYYMDLFPRDPPDDPGPNYDPPPEYTSDGWWGRPGNVGILAVHFMLFDSGTDSYLDHYGWVRLAINEPPASDLQRPPYLSIRNYAWESTPGVPVTAPIPEPATCGLLGLWLLAMGGWRKLRSRNPIGSL